MKLQPASQKELARIAAGTALCTAVMVAVFAALGAVGIVKFGTPVVLGAVVGAAVAVANFAMLCLTVQKVAEQPDDKNARAKMQLSYNARLMFQAAWCIAAFWLPYFQVVSAVLPLLFPRIVIFVLQASGIYRAPASGAQASPEPDTSAAPPAQPPEEERGE